MSNYIDVRIDYQTICTICQSEIGSEDNDVVIHSNPKDIQEGAGCHFHKGCARTWTLQKDECSICRAGINPASILTADEIRDRSDMQKAEDITDEADRLSDDERLARELEAEGGSGAAAPAGMDAASAALIAALAEEEDYQGSFGAGTFGAAAAPDSDEVLAARLQEEEAFAASLGEAPANGGSDADFDAAVAASLRDAPTAGAGAAAPAAVVHAAPIPVVLPAPAAGGVAPAIRDRCNQALVMVAGVAGAVAAIAFTMLQQKDN